MPIAAWSTNVVIHEVQDYFDPCVIWNSPRGLSPGAEECPNRMEGRGGTKRESLFWILAFHGAFLVGAALAFTGTATGRRLPIAVAAAIYLIGFPLGLFSFFFLLPLLAGIACLVLAVQEKGPQTRQVPVVVAGLISAVVGGAGIVLAVLERDRGIAATVFTALALTMVIGGLAILSPDKGWGKDAGAGI